MEKINVTKLKCLRCQTEWIPRKEYVLQCPNKDCRSPFWNLTDEEFKKIGGEK
jgi:hypothetical protein